jgi:uncharacterized protein YbjT (DUF2867 family)
MEDLARPVLVIGATGQQGGAVARALLTQGRSVHAVVRDPGTPAAQELSRAGADLVTGDLDDSDSLRAAMAGVHGVFLLLTMMAGPVVTAAGVEAERRRGVTVAHIAASAGVRHLVYSSIANADRHTGIAHVESKGHIEAHIRSLDLPATMLRPVSFMENFGTYSRPTIVDGELVVSLALRPDTPLQLISTRDIGALAALVFAQPDTFVGQQVPIAGDVLTGRMIAERFGTVYGLPARFAPVPIERLRAFDPEVAKMFEYLDGGDPERADVPALRSLYPRLMTLADWLQTEDRPVLATTTADDKRT